VRQTIVGLAVLLLAACSPNPSPHPTVVASASSNEAVSTLTSAAGGMTFERPSTWVPWQQNLHAPFTNGPLLYLSTDPLLSACAVAMGAKPNPPDSAGQACQWPLTTLSAGGVLVEWINDRILTPLPTTGEAITMNGSTARIQTALPGSCATIGADVTLVVLVPTSVSATMSNLSVIACLRGPDLGASEAQVRAMLESATETP
jgi:hypothetical protein